MSIPYFKNWRILVDAAVSGNVVSITSVDFYFRGAQLDANGANYFQSAGDASGIFRLSAPKWEAENGDWAAVSFSVSQCIDDVKITAIGNSAPKDFRVQYSNDRVEWYDCAIITNITGWM